MPALWPTFIPTLASDLSGQSFTKPGGAMLSYDLPKVGKDQVPIFPPSAELVESLKPGNPANTMLVTDPTTMVNAINLAPLSGRYDFGVNVAERYLEAVKGLAMTPFGATHSNNPAAELILKQGYGLIFEQILKEGDIPLQDQKDADGNITTMGKESHPDYADFCPGPIEEPDPVELEKKRQKKFNKFIEDFKDDSVMDLKKFKFFEFHCLDGDETELDFIYLIVNRMLQQFETITNTADKLDYAMWATSLGKINYQNMNDNDKQRGDTTFRNLWPYPNVPNSVRTRLTSVGYDWEIVVNTISSKFKLAIQRAYYDDTVVEVSRSSETNNVINLGSSFTNITTYTNPRDNMSATFDVGQFSPIIRPWPYDTKEKPECMLSVNKIQVSYDRENDLPDNESKRPKVLSDEVVAFFSYDNSSQVSKSFTLSIFATGFDSSSDPEGTVYWWKKSDAYINTQYVISEWEIGWNKIPANINTVRSPEDIIAMNPNTGGTQFKFTRQQVIDAIEGAAICDEAEPDANIDYDWPGGDPWIKMGQVTIAYWYACLIQPFAASPSAMPAMIPPPLTGIYIPIYYGSAKRLGNNLRKAWATGKTFSVIPAPQPPAMAVSVAVAAAYALHLLEFKLLYLGGIPTPAGPIPMIGMVPVVF